jgi:hypothetical protein
MKIGILTYHYAHNFGANLQVLSTVGHLRGRGHIPVVIDWRPECVEEQYRRNTHEEQAAVHREYAASHLPLSPLCRTDAEIADVIKCTGIEAVIVGSDAVASLSPKYDRLGFSGRQLRFVLSKPLNVNLLPNPFWGSFLDHVERAVPCAMMSVSSQNTRYSLMSSGQRRLASDGLRRFAYVSARDSWTKEMMAWISRGACDPEVTPDPVFAFNANVDPQLTDRATISRFRLPDKYILVSFKREHSPPEAWVRQFARLAETRGYACVALPYPQGLNAMSLDLRVELPLSPLEWYALIRHSAGYVGHNMHPIVSCIHNRVPFYSFDNYGYLMLKMLNNAKSSKIYDLLERCGLLGNRTGVIGRWASYPEPQQVLRGLETFEGFACEAAATQMQDRYRAMMRALLVALETDQGTAGVGGLVRQTGHTGTEP